MALIEELPASALAAADLHRIPLAEMPAVSSDELRRTIGRMLPGPSATPVPVAAFQSSLQSVL
jgi:FXSXX-COOH protein